MRENRSVRGEGNSGKRRSFYFEPSHYLRGQMLGVCRTASVPTNEQFVTPLKSGDQQLGDPHHVSHDVTELSEKPLVLVQKLEISIAYPPALRMPFHLTRIMHETPWRDRGDGRATG